MQTVLRCPYSPCVQSQGSTSARTAVKKDQAVAAIALSGHTKILHTLVGSAALAAAGVRRPEFPERNNEVNYVLVTTSSSVLLLYFLFLLLFSLSLSLFLHPRKTVSKALVFNCSLCQCRRILLGEYSSLELLVYFVLLLVLSLLLFLSSFLSPLSPFPRSSLSPPLLPQPLLLL